LLVESALLAHESRGTFRRSDDDAIARGIRHNHRAIVEEFNTARSNELDLAKRAQRAPLTRR
jgi:hypothetical protein